MNKITVYEGRSSYGNDVEILGFATGNSELVENFFKNICPNYGILHIYPIQVLVIDENSITEYKSLEEEEKKLEERLKEIRALMR